MKSLINRLADKFAFQLVASGLMFVAVGTLVIGVMAALAVYVHPLAAIMFLFFFFAFMAYLFGI